MSLELCILASGSMGNCSVVRAPGGGVMLIDAGIGPRVTAKRMNGTGVSIRDVRAICLTHLDSDHFRPSWLGTIVRHGIRVFCHESRRRDLLQGSIDDQTDPSAQRQFRSLVRGFNGEPFAPLDGLSVRSISLAHDQLGSHAFLIDGFGARIGYATDLGHVPRDLIDGFCDVDVLAVESNYDPEMQVTSGRPHHGRPGAPLERAGASIDPRGARPLPAKAAPAARAHRPAASQPRVQLPQARAAHVRAGRTYRAAPDAGRTVPANRVDPTQCRAAPRR
jgi:Cft2 family RNA processing exonuclease